MVFYLLIAACFAVAAWLYWLGRSNRATTQRDGLLRQIMDHADGLERELLDCRSRLGELQPLNSDPADAGTEGNAGAQIESALRDLLAHRLWLRDHGETASMERLQEARDALIASRSAISEQLARLTAAHDELQSALRELSARTRPSDSR